MHPSFEKPAALFTELNEIFNDALVTQYVNDSHKKIFDLLKTKWNETSERILADEKQDASKKLKAVFESLYTLILIIHEMPQKSLSFNYEIQAALEVSLQEQNPPFHEPFEKHIQASLPQKKEKPTIDYEKIKTLAKNRADEAIKFAAQKKATQVVTSDNMVALLDIDNTLVYSVDGKLHFNFALIEALKKKGIHDVYLFSKLDVEIVYQDYSDHADDKDSTYYTREWIIKHLKEQGFRLHGMITTFDDGYAEQGEAYDKLVPLYTLAESMKADSLTTGKFPNGQTFDYKKDPDDFHLYLKSQVEAAITQSPEYKAADEAYQKARHRQAIKEFRVYAKVKQSRESAQPRFAGLFNEMHIADRAQQNQIKEKIEKIIVQLIDKKIPWGKAQNAQRKDNNMAFKTLTDEVSRLMVANGFSIASEKDNPLHTFIVDFMVYYYSDFSPRVYDRKENMTEFFFRKYGLCPPAVLLCDDDTAVRESFARIAAQSHIPVAETLGIDKQDFSQQNNALKKYLSHVSAFVDKRAKKVDFRLLEKKLAEVSEAILKDAFYIEGSMRLHIVDVNQQFIRAIKELIKEKQYAPLIAKLFTGIIQFLRSPTRENRQAFLYQFNPGRWVSNPVLSQKIKTLFEQTIEFANVANIIDREKHHIAPDASKFNGVNINHLRSEFNSLIIDALQEEKTTDLDPLITIVKNTWREDVEKLSDEKQANGERVKALSAKFETLYALVQFVIQYIKPDFYTLHAAKINSLVKEAISKGFPFDSLMNFLGKNLKQDAKAVSSMRQMAENALMAAKKTAAICRNHAYKKERVEDSKEISDISRLNYCLDVIDGEQKFYKISPRNNGQVHLTEKISAIKKVLLEMQGDKQNIPLVSRLVNAIVGLLTNPDVKFFDNFKRVYNPARWMLNEQLREQMRTITDALEVIVPAVNVIKEKRKQPLPVAEKEEKQVSQAAAAAEIGMFGHHAESQQKLWALLDVDDTLLLRTGSAITLKEFYNDALIESLKEKGITDIYLLTNMGQDTIVQELGYTLSRPMLISYLQKAGFKVHGVITQNDYGYSQFSPGKTIGDFYKDFAVPLYAEFHNLQLAEFKKRLKQLKPEDIAFPFNDPNFIAVILQDYQQKNGKNPPEDIFLNLYKYYHSEELFALFENKYHGDVKALVANHFNNNDRASMASQLVETKACQRMIKADADAKQQETTLVLQREFPRFFENFTKEKPFDKLFAEIKIEPTDEAKKNSIKVLVKDVVWHVIKMGILDPGIKKELKKFIKLNGVDISDDKLPHLQKFCINMINKFFGLKEVNDQLEFIRNKGLMVQDFLGSIQGMKANGVVVADDKPGPRDMAKKALNNLPVDQRPVLMTIAVERPSASKSEIVDHAQNQEYAKVVYGKVLGDLLNEVSKTKSMPTPPAAARGGFSGKR